jgi:hypothetical protein
MPSRRLVHAVFFDNNPLLNNKKLNSFLSLAVRRREVFVFSGKHFAPDKQAGYTGAKVYPSPVVRTVRFRPWTA